MSLARDATPSQVRTRLGYSIGAICLAAFALMLWTPLLDALDSEWPIRDAVAEHGGDTQWNIERADGVQRSAAVAASLAVLSPAYRRFVESVGGKLILTTKAALAAAQTRAPNALVHTAGLYLPDAKTALIAHDTEDPGWTALHELGHLIDHQSDRLSTSDGFLRIYERLSEDPRLDEYARSSSGELFAELFSRYYFSDRRRAHLQQRFPEAAEYMRSLEARILASY